MDLHIHYINDEMLVQVLCILSTAMSSKERKMIMSYISKSDLTQGVNKVDVVRIVKRSLNRNVEILTSREM